MFRRIIMQVQAIKKSNMHGVDQPNLYVVFEGILCSGKTTQLQMTRHYLIGKELNVACFEEAGEKTRVLFRQLSIPDDWVEGHLFVADTLIQNRLIQEVKPNTVILAERSFLSTLVYQASLGDGRIYEWHNIHIDFDRISVQPILMSESFRMPDAIIILDVSAKTALERARNSPVPHTIEKWENDPEKLEQARQRYLDLAVEKRDEFMFPIHIIKQQSIENTWNEVREIINELRYLD